MGTCLLSLHVYLNQVNCSITFMKKNCSITSSCSVKFYAVYMMYLPKSVPLFQMKEILGDYDAIHVRRGDLLKNRKDRFGVERSLHPHLDRDTRPEYIRKRIVKWIPPGRTLYIASNERTPGFFSSLSDRYHLHYFPWHCLH